MHNEASGEENSWSQANGSQNEVSSLLTRVSGNLLDVAPFPSLNAGTPPAVVFAPAADDAPAEGALYIDARPPG